MSGRGRRPAARSKVRLLLAASVTSAVIAAVLGRPGGASEAGGAKSQASFVAVVALQAAAQIAIVRGPPWRVVRRARMPSGPHNVAPSHRRDPAGNLGA